MKKNDDNKSTLKALAADAKARMKSGYRTEAQEEAQPSYFDVVKQSVRQAEDIKRADAFKAQVAEILKDETVTNPISRLVDEEYLSTLDYSARQRYLLEISEKFNRARQELERDAAQKKTSDQGE